MSTKNVIYRLNAIAVDLPMVDRSEVEIVNLGFFLSHQEAELAMRRPIETICESEIVRFDVIRLPIGEPQPEGPITSYDQSYTMLNTDRGFAVGDIVGVIYGSEFRIGILLGLPEQPDNVCLVDFITVVDSGYRDHDHPEISELIVLNFTPPKHLIEQLAILMLTKEEVASVTSRTRLRQQGASLRTKGIPED